MQLFFLAAFYPGSLQLASHAQFFIRGQNERVITKFQQYMTWMNFLCFTVKDQTTVQHKKRSRDGNINKQWLPYLYEQYEISKLILPSGLWDQGSESDYMLK